MATSKSNYFEEYVKGLLECPVCMEPIKSAPIHQCTNGHVLCKDCIAKLESCPICRNDSNTARNLILEQILENFSAFEFENEKHFEKPEHKKWGASLSSNRLKNEEPSVHLDIQPNSEIMESVELGATDNRSRSTLKCDDIILAFWNCVKFLCVLLYVIGGISFCIFILAIVLNLFYCASVGIPEEGIPEVCKPKHT